MSFIQSSTITPHQRVHTGENLMSVVNVGKLLPTIITSLSTGEFTLEKSLEHNDCGKSFTHRFTRIQHHRVHKCSDCRKFFRQRSNFIQYQRVHSGAKPYECSECGKSFTCNNHLLIHKRVHIGEKLYACTDYGKFVIFINIRGVNTHILPMGQGVIASFKDYYLRRTFAMAFRATEKDKELTLNDFWKSYNVLAAVKNISDSWDEIKQTNLNGVWKKLCPLFVNDFHGFEDSFEVVIKNVVELSKQLDSEVEAEDVTELLASHGEEVYAEDLTQLKQQFIEEEDTPTPDPRRFTSKELSGAFAMIEDALARFEAQDPNSDRYTKVARVVMDSLRCYNEIWEDKNKTHLTQYLQYLLQVLPLRTHLAQDLQHLLQVLPLRTHLTQYLQHLLKVLPLRTHLTQYQCIFCRFCLSNLLPQQPNHQATLNTEEPHVTMRVHRNVSVEKDITSGLNVKELPARNRKLLIRKVSAPEDMINESNKCGKVSDKILTTYNMGEFALSHGEKPLCVVTVGSLHRRSHLTRHHRVHTGEKPYECGDCGKSSPSVLH
ncbi:hypothetical protein QTO34_014161 [Cnephaeus nilssonii]|uniref:C2H2-type domain-containing protein n=1 Tax=Cnephaeus nilssonii TaxID=3371016 RepID=A0AA40HAL8_CNENI|nr:hypothetical protein QTO34_014161 [Eptesicus nilssonii]